VDINTVLQAIPSSIGSVFSEIGVSANTSAGVTICNYGVGCDGETGFTGTLQVNALSGAVNGVHLEIEVGGARGTATDFDGGTASVDPYIYVDPTFLNAGDYSIEVSPNIGNISAAPLPATAWLLGSALVGAGLFMRRYGKGPRLAAA
jgi:hypothetical protein